MIDNKYDHKYICQNYILHAIELLEFSHVLAQDDQKCHFINLNNEAFYYLKVAAVYDAEELTRIADLVQVDLLELRKENDKETISNSTAIHCNLIESVNAELQFEIIPDPSHRMTKNNKIGTTEMLFEKKEPKKMFADTENGELTELKAKTDKKIIEGEI